MVKSICCRSRVKKVYTAYSRKPIEEVWQNVVDLHVQYLIVQMNWCNDRSRSEFKQAIYLFLARISLMLTEDTSRRYKIISVVVDS